MNDQISALMDSELDENEAKALLAKFKDNHQLSESWAVYHQIGDSLRQTQMLSNALTEKISARLENEPTVLAPHKITPPRREMIAWSAAASFAAVAVVAFAMLKFSSINNQEVSNLASASNQPAKAVIASTSNSNMNDYLYAHQEYSPATPIQSASGFALVTYSNEQGSAR